MKISVAFDAECACWMASVEWEEETENVDLCIMTQVEEIHGNLTVGSLLIAINALLEDPEDD